MDDLYDRYRPKAIIDINIIPILDMLIAVIFFLVLSTSFIGYTKLQVPPSAVSTLTNPIAPAPLAPKIIVEQKGDEVRMILTWKGATPGERIESVRILPNDSRALVVQSKSHEMLRAFSTQYPKERTLQIGLKEDVPYQVLIALMDSSRDTLPDVVLISYLEAQAQAAQY